MVDERTETAWNFDEDRNRELNFYLSSAGAALVNYDLISAHSCLLAIRRIAFAKFENEEKERINNLFNQLQDLKNRAWEGDRKALEDMYLKEDEIYIEINTLLKQYGFYFREKEDLRGL